MKRFALPILAVLVLANLLRSQAQPPDPNQPKPAAWIEASFAGRPSPASERIQDGAILSVPTNIWLEAGVNSAVPGSEGDYITIEILVDTNRLCSQRCKWYPGIHPDPNSRNFQPMIISLPRYDNIDHPWANPPVGSHVLTAQVTGKHGLSLTSEPLHITIVPAPPRQGGAGP